MLFLFNVKKTDYKKGDIAIFIADQFFEDVLKPNFEESSYSYILILFHLFFLTLDEEKCKILCNYFFSTENFKIYNLTYEYISIIQENNKYLMLLDEKEMNALIAYEENGRVQFKFKLKRKNESDNMQKENYEINVDNIIDKKIKIIMDKVKFSNIKDFNTLIDEPFNIIYKYIISKSKNCKITLLLS